MDTVHPEGLLGTPAVRREGEFIYAPGVADCKRGIVADLLETLGVVGYYVHSA
jgi:acetylornithine deacetylase/succinyl-diaminopimelate desuccinylase-like protein